MSSEKRHNPYVIAAEYAHEEWRAEQKLARAVIINAIRDSQQSTHRTARDGAVAWLASDAVEECSFLWWLGFLSDRPEGVAETIRGRLGETFKPINRVDASFSNQHERKRYLRCTRDEAAREKIAAAVSERWHRMRTDPNQTEFLEWRRKQRVALDRLMRERRQQKKKAEGD